MLVLFESVRYEVGAQRASTTASASAENETPPTIAPGGEVLPDFYFIILDAYTRSDVLAYRFGYDNTAFTQQLSEMGFYVASCSQSNYASTKLSLSSAMYADYIQNVVDAGGILPSLKVSAISQTLKSLGYQIVSFENRASGHFDLKEDLLFSRNQMAFGAIELTGGINEFEKMMIDTSFLRFVADTELIPGFNNTTTQQWDLWEHYHQTHYILNELEKVADISGPKFVFVHLMVPHSPFIFAPDGSFRRTNDPIDGYRANVEFLDNHLPTALRAILEKSHPAPIIVIMGDHGPSTRKTITHQMRMATLNAYLVNEAARAQLYPTITPINASRIILNAHFGTDFPPLDDISYYAYKVPELLEAEIIPNECSLTH